MPGSQTPPGEKYPDLPLRSDYLDLVRLSGGGDLLGLVGAGERLPALGWAPTRGRDRQGHAVLRWDVPVKGRSQLLPVEIRLDAEAPDTPAHRAHLMVWPRFRTPSWKTYYLYERCSDPRLFCDVLWTETATGRLHRRRHDGSQHPYPLAFRTGAEAAHTGGPPLALALRNVKSDEEQGLYLVHLEPRGPRQEVALALGVDFGTSHSVAAVRVAGEAPQQVQLPADLDGARRGGGMTLHVSEDRAHVQASYEEAGILANASWLPTYRERGEGILPSELLLRRKLVDAQAEPLERWQPVRDFTMPPMDIVRSNLAEHVLTDFKWDTTSSYFKGSEGKLREHYLGLFLELVLASVIEQHLHGYPTEPIDVTCTYPLRSGETQFQTLGESLARLLRRAQASSGLALRLKAADSGEDGRYDESRAARVETNSLGEVSLVADLGGGTLDLFIAPYRNDAGASGGGDGAADAARLLEVADSVRLGGNLVLRHIAEHPRRYLPAGWPGADARAVETNLRTWMRSRGSASLFGYERSDGVQLAEMRGFANPAEAGPARQLLDRYFRLIVEYMARNLAAYLAKHWLVEMTAHHGELCISVQLRGNGWRLWYQRESYEQIAQAIQGEVRQRLVELWPQIADNPFPAAG